MYNMQNATTFINNNNDNTENLHFAVGVLFSVATFSVVVLDWLAGNNLSSSRLMAYNFSDLVCCCCCCWWWSSSLSSSSSAAVAVAVVVHCTWLTIASRRRGVCCCRRGGGRAGGASELSKSIRESAQNRRSVLLTRGTWKNEATSISQSFR